MKILALSLAIAGLVAARAAETVEDLWRGVDVRTASLEATTEKEWRDRETVVRVVSFTSHRAGNGRVRIVGYYGFPAGTATAPGLLHIHGGGQTANREYVDYFARRGYAVLSINWGGHPLPGGLGNSDWGDAFVAQGDNARVFSVGPDARSNPWFGWALACRRGLTFLEQQREVDAARLGVFGISMGGRLVWLVAGVDDRVKAAVSVYGAVAMADDLPGLPGSAQMDMKPADAPIWRTLLDATAYAPRIRSPFLYLSAANDFYGAMDFADETLATIPHPNHRQLFPAHWNHHVDFPHAETLRLWLDTWLRDGPAWPATPAMKVESDTGGRRVVVTPETPWLVRSVEIHLSTDPYPQSRYWERVPVVPRPGQREWEGILPSTPGSKTWVYAGVEYATGVCLSSRLLVLPVDAAPADGQIPTHVFDDFSQGAAHWFVPEAGANPLLQSRVWLRTAEGPDGRPGLQAVEQPGRVWSMATRRIGDARFRQGPAGVLAFPVWSQQGNTLVVVATENERRRPFDSAAYVAAVPLEAQGWQWIRLTPAAFRSARDGRTLSSWDQVNLLTLRGSPPDAGTKNPWAGPPPVIGGLRWEAGTR